MLVLITGGARSGKSTFAERYARDRGKEVIYIATSPVVDEETRLRIEEHRRRRPAGWRTVEEPYHPERVLASHDGPGRLFLLDCLTMWLSNCLLEQAGLAGEQIDEPDGFRQASQALRSRIDALAASTRNLSADVVVVSNETGMGLVPDNPLGRLYRDQVGWANQTLAALADEVYVLFSGIPLRLK